MRDLCDRVYVLHLDRLERHVLAERQVVATLLAAGAKGMTMPLLSDAVADFDAALLAPPKVITRERLELMRALGVAG